MPPNEFTDQDGVVEALAEHRVSSRDLHLGHAAQTAAEQAVEYKLARMLSASGAELESVEIDWVCQGRATGRKGGNVQVIEVRTLPPAAPECQICGNGARRRLTTGEWRCDFHA